MISLLTPAVMVGTRNMPMTGLPPPAAILQETASTSAPGIMLT